MARPRDIAPRFQACRAFMHAWDFGKVERKGDVLIQWMRCARGCGTEKKIAIDRYGERVPRLSGFVYHDKDYLLEGGAMTVKERSRCRLSEVRAHL